jgi:O-antigen/teichoic acid export membrane protein
MAAGLGVDLAAAVVLRGLSLATTVLVARALREADYGAVSLALAIYGVSDMLTNPALGIAIIRRPELDVHTVDVAWTLSLLRAALLGAGIYVAAPLLATAWHGASETVGYLRILSLAPLSSAISNLHAIRLQRSLRFGSSMLLDNARLVAGSLTSLVLLLITRSAQALVTGIVVGNCVHSLLSWIVIQPRPRLAFSKQTLRELTEVSRWLMIHGVLVYLGQTIDNLYVGHALGLAALGAYALAWRLVNTFMTLFTRAIAKMLVPAYRDVSSDAAELARMVRSTLYPSAAVGAWASGIVLLCASDLFALVAGKHNYLGAASIARALTPFVYTRIINNVLGPLYQGVGEPRTLTLLSTLNVFLLVPALVLGAHLLGVVGVAAAMSAVTVCVSAILVVLVSRRFQLALGDQLKAALLPVVAATPAVLVGALVTATLRGAPARLLVGVTAVSLVFVATWELLRRLFPSAPSIVGPVVTFLRSRLRSISGTS